MMKSTLTLIAVAAATFESKRNGGISVEAAFTSNDLNLMTFNSRKAVFSLPSSVARKCKFKSTHESTHPTKAFTTSNIRSRTKSALFSSQGNADVDFEIETETIDQECNGIVILGGGFGGLNTALTLDALPWQQYNVQKPKIKLVDNKERFIFLPLLYELCVGDAELDEVAPTFESLLANNPNIEFVQRDVQGIDIDNDKVYLTKTKKDLTSTAITTATATATATTITESISYKSLIVATGSSINLSSIKGASTYALPFYTVQHCYELRKQLNILDSYLQSLIQNQEQQPKDISIVIVGGGYSGVELALNLKERLAIKSKRTKNNKTDNTISNNLPNVNVTLLHRGEEVLQYATEYNKRNGQQRLIDAGVQICTGQSVLEVLPSQHSSSIHQENDDPINDLANSLKYKCQVVTNESTIDADLLLWTAGAMASNEQRDILNSKLPRDSKGRIVTNQYLQVKDVSNVYALGDCSRPKKIPYAATAAVAMQQAPAVAWNVFASTTRQSLETSNNGEYIRRKKELDPLPFEYIDLGQMMTLGGDDATISSLSGAFEIDGSIASIARRLIYAVRMPTLQQALTAAISSTNKRLEKSSLNKVNKIIDWNKKETPMVESAFDNQPLAHQERRIIKLEDKVEALTNELKNLQEKETHMVESAFNNQSLAHQERCIMELEDKVEALTNELKNLQDQLTELIISTEKQQETANQEQQSSSFEGALAVGDEVKIRNPKRGQPDSGIITKVKSLYVFIKTKDGREIRRARKNISKH